MAYAANWRGFAPGFENSFQVEIVGNRKIIPLLRSTSSYGSNFTYLPFSIINRLLQFRPHVIFSNSFGMWTLLALLLKPIGRWKVVIAYEGSSPGVDYRKSPPRLWLRSWMLRIADACITNSAAGKQYLTEVLRASEGEVFMHPYEVPSSNAFSQNAFSQAQDEQAASSLTQSSTKRVFLYVGSLVPRKGLKYLLEACSRLQEWGCEDYLLNVVGDGDERSSLEAYCHNHGLIEQVQWLGRVDYAQLGEQFHKADVFVLPTLEDTWGMVVLEAMVAHLPVLCSQWAGASELILDAQNGFCFDPKDPDSLAHLMQKFILNSELSSQMGRTAGVLMKNYTPAEAADFMVNVVDFVMVSRAKSISKSRAFSR
ncbi:glycosyltransferase family 4 protein [Halomicronema hongdechloris]|uniref:glycosyltransferase family 4 protein n=1 Tax=Halomicronema hongdechloris TaxID=1209493 RepID=UPI00211AD84C|nr:glycosyltransferase family 4 protein [Halomicronema hongdechloris]